MKFKKITLNNIRSYEHQEIDFSEGSILLSGDIGAGKTSILLGIEFGLFGLQPGQKGSALLRNGEDSGSVTLEFEIKDKHVKVHRKLKRGKTVSQDTCYIEVDGVREELAVTQLKSRILDLLNYPKEFSKKQNLLYKFTVYTPQEEMKQIILQDSETRTNTLRYIFGIEKYKRIIENASILISKVREEKRVNEAIASNIDDEKTNLEKKENELEEKQYNLASVEKELFIKTEERKKVQEEKEAIEKKIEEKKQCERELEKIDLTISHKNEIHSSNLKKLEQLKAQIEEISNIQGVSFYESNIKDLQTRLETKNKEKEEINDKIISITSKINSLDEKTKEKEEIKSRITHLETCPTCMQKVDTVYKDNIFAKAEEEIKTNNMSIKTLGDDKKNFLEKSSEINKEITGINEKINELSSLKAKVENLEKKKEEKTQIEESNKQIVTEIENLKSESSKIKEKINEFSKYDEDFKKKTQEFETFSKEERLAEIKVAELKKEIQMFSNQIEELKEKIKKSEEVKEKVKYLMELENWLSNDFVSMISVIEKNIMIKLKSEFSRIFSEWFSMLVSDNFNVYVRDDFTPIIELQDYEVDYSYLSGGERTAIALAYRLALNQVINSVLSNIETKDIVILDEPTDGFSDMQLDKMRDVLQQLNVKQLIIVSHEQKVEGFVDNVIKLKKEDGTSAISEKKDG